MKRWKAPPIAKVFEALGAVADKRVTIQEGNSAIVVSSDGSKSYVVEWGDEFEWITSNDNASFWQGYIGYPIVAVLVILGRLRASQFVSDSLKGICWKELNTRFKNNYTAVLATVLAELPPGGANRNDVETECSRLLSDLSALSLSMPDKKRVPPKASKETNPELFP